MSALLWAKLFGLTVLFEVPLVVALLRDAEPSRARRLVIAFAAQLATHPVVFFVFPQLSLRGFSSLTLSELYAWLFEAVIFAAAFRELSLLRAIGVAGLANGLSFGLGLLLRD